MSSIDYTAGSPPRLSPRIHLWYGRPMAGAAAHTQFESPWVTAVSVEDDAGRIHEFTIPEGVCTHGQFLARMYAAWLQQPVRPSEVHRESLSDLLVMAVLGFWTALVGNLLFVFFFAADAPRDWMVVPEGCVSSASTGRCIADFG